MKKILFYNISGAIHSNNILEILILFEYFRNMYPCHWHFNIERLNWNISKFAHICLILKEKFCDHLDEENINLRCIDIVMRFHYHSLLN